MGSVMEYTDISLEHRGSMAKGRLKMTDSSIVFKSSKTGKLETLSGSDVDVVNWQRFAGTWGLRIFAKNGALLRFGGFKDADKDKLAKFFHQNYGVVVVDKEFSLKGWNWGTAKFNGSVLTFDISRDPAFDIPLGSVSQCTTGKNEVTLEFHQNDDAPVGLMEMRFHIPSSELAGDDPVEAFREQVMGKASIISATGDAIAIFREAACLTPRGRYDIKMFPSFFQLHGKTFDYKITMNSILRMFLLPHKDGRQTFFVISLDPPIKQGQTRYHFLVFLFSQDDDDISVELPFSEQELKTKFDGRLQKEMNGPMFEVLSKVFKALVNRKVTTPGKFKGHSGTPAIGCSYKSAVGYLYPLDRGFVFIHKPPMHIRFEEISSVNFARSGGSTRSFDFEVELKNGIVHTFNSIEKEEYHKLFDFITEKQLRVKNRGKLDKPTYTGDFEDSDAEAEPDAYLARVKAEAQERSDDDDDESSEDEDYNPEKDKNKPKHDGSESSAGSSDESEDYDPDNVGSDMDMETGKSSEKKKKSSGEKRKRDKDKGKKKSKKEKDSDAPKRAQTAYFLWFNANRENLKKKHSGLSIIELSKKAGELWRALGADDKKEWEDKHKKSKERYDEEMKEYRKNGPGPSTSKKGSTGSSGKSKSSPSKKVSTSAGSGGGFKSKEFVSDDSDSSASENEKKKKKAKAPASKAKPKMDKANMVKKEAPGSDSEEKSASGGGSGSEDSD